MPIYHKAVAAVNNLSGADVTEMSRVSTPSPGLMIVAQSLCYIFLPENTEKAYKVKKINPKDPDTWNYWPVCQS